MAEKSDKQEQKGALFPALLRYWRERRGLSQLDLSLEAEVSTKHLSFLETNRAAPSREMVLRLFAVLAVPLREQNEALVAAGFAPFFEMPEMERIPREIEQALAQMIEQHEPFPISAISIDGGIICASRGAWRLFEALLGRAVSSNPSSPANIYDLCFDPRLLRPFIIDWADFARALVARLHRERLLRGDARLANVLERVFAFPDVPRSWTRPDFSKPAAATLQVGFFRPRTQRDSSDELRVRFLVTATTFYSPQQVNLDELRIESCFPLDDETRATCVRLAKVSETRL